MNLICLHCSEVMILEEKLMVITWGSENFWRTFVKKVIAILEK